MTSFQENEFEIDVVDADGHAAGPIIKPPASLGAQRGWDLTAVRAGGILTTAIGGTYDLQPGEARLVTHGAVLAAGPTRYLIYECSNTAQCTTWVVDRATGHHSALPDYPPMMATGYVAGGGVISPDGQYAAVFSLASDGPQTGVVNLDTGESERIDVPQVNPAFTSDASSFFAFTPDSRFLITATSDGVYAVDPGIGEVLQTLPVPPLIAISVRPAQ